MTQHNCISTLLLLTTEQDAHPCCACIQLLHNHHTATTTMVGSNYFPQKAETPTAAAAHSLITGRSDSSMLPRT